MQETIKQAKNRPNNKVENKANKGLKMMERFVIYPKLARILPPLWGGEMNCKY